MRRAHNFEYRFYGLSDARKRLAFDGGYNGDRIHVCDWVYQPWVEPSYGDHPTALATAIAKGGVGIGSESGGGELELTAKSKSIRQLVEDLDAHGKFTPKAQKEKKALKAA